MIFFSMAEANQIAVTCLGAKIPKFKFQDPKKYRNSKNLLFIFFEPDFCLLFFLWNLIFAILDFYR